jgi:hypothetical protein
MNHGLFVGDKFAGYWNENGDFFLPLCFYNYSAPLDSLVHTQKINPVPIRGTFMIAEYTFLKFCETTVESTYPIRIKRLRKIPMTLGYSNQFVENHSKLFGKAFRMTEEIIDTSAMGYFSNNVCVMLKVAGKLFQPGIFSASHPVVDNVVFCEKWPMYIRKKREGRKSMKMNITRGGFPIRSIREIDWRFDMQIQSFTTKKIEEVVYVGLYGLEYDGCRFYRSAALVADELVEIKEEPKEFVPLDEDRRGDFGIEKRKFLDSKNYVVQMGEDFYSNKGQEVSYVSEPDIAFEDFCEILGVYSDLGRVVWSMVFD